MAPMNPAMMVMRGLVFHPLLCMVLINGLYLVCLCMRACSENLSCQYVNSMNWTVCVREGAIGVCVWFGLSLCIGCPVEVWCDIHIMFVGMCI
jgi:hypothetical protein